MPRATLALLPFLISIATHAQISLDGTVTSQLYGINSLTAGTKLIERPPGGPTVTIYNIDLTPYRVLTLSAAPVGYIWNDPWLITQALFDTDSTTIEYLLFGNDGGSGPGITWIARQDGSVLFTTPGQCIRYGTTELDAGLAIFETSAGAKMLIQNLQLGTTQLYSLPGHVPCVASCQPAATASFATGAGEQIALPSGSHAYPNPANDHLSITYTLPEGTTQARLVLHDASGRVVLERSLGPSGTYALETASIPNGLYTYEIIGPSGVLSASKIVVMH